MAGWLYVNSRQLCKRMSKLPSTFCAAIRPSVNFQYCLRTSAKFCKPSMRQEDFLSTFFVADRLPSTSINFPRSYESFRQLLSTFCAAGRTSVKFHEFFVRPGTFLQLPSTFRGAGSTSVNFRQNFVQTGDLQEIFGNLPCSRDTFQQLL